MLTITDLFCGAGGSSSGAEQVPGVRVRMAANHWALAVETHNRNLPHADHDTADISQVDPRRYPRTDILWASPECTNHSQAKGRRRGDGQPDLFGETLPDEASERSRATMWDVVRFAERHGYRAIVVENVVDVLDWGPPVAPKGALWTAWLGAIAALGYEHRVVFLNSMFAAQFGAPAPQSRDRVYVVCWRRGDRAPDLDRWTRPVAWCPLCDRAVRAVQAWKRTPHRGRHRQQYVYRCPSVTCRNTEVYPGVLPAAVAIDWSLAGQQIGQMKTKTFRDKKTGVVTEGPLAPKTLARIEAGLRRYARPIHLEAAGNTPMMVPAGGTWNDTAATVVESFRTRTTRDTEALVVPVEGRDSLAARPASDPARTQTARLQDALVVPLRNNGVARPADEAPAPTVAAAGNHHALIMRNNQGAAELSTPVTEPLRTLTAAGHQSLIRWDDAMLMRNMTARGDQGQMSTPLTEPMRTVLSEGPRASLVRWDHLLVPYYGTAVARPVGQPTGTVTTHDRNALIGPDVAIEDCTFRMLEPHEIQAAMAFGASYVVLGNKRERVRQLGNAVTPPAARDLIAAVVEALTGEAVS